MTNNLPEKYEAALATVGGQAALFEDSNQLLELTDAGLRHVAALYCDRMETGLAEMRRNFGLLAWAGWLKFEGAPYEQFVSALAKAAAVHVRTVKAWRDSVVEKDDLAVPAATAQRKEEAKARENRRSKPVRAENLHGTAPIPAASTEAPAKSSEGGGTGTHQPPASGATQLAPSGPSSGGAGIQPPPRPTGDPTSPLSAPPDPIEYGTHVDDTTDVHVDVDAIGLRWLKSKTTREVRAIGDPWGPAIRAEVRRWAEAFGAPPAPAEKPQRRQGTITRPQGAVVAGRAIEQRSEKIDGHEDCLRPGIMPARFNSTPAPKTAAKRHALDCSCLGCKPEKAVAK